MYLMDRLEWPTFFDQLARIIAIRDELKRDEVKCRPLVQKWIERNNDITAMCIFVIQLPCHQIEKIFDLLSTLEKTVDKVKGKKDNLNAHNKQIQKILNYCIEHVQL